MFGARCTSIPPQDPQRLEIALIDQAGLSQSADFESATEEVVESWERFDTGSPWNPPPLLRCVPAYRSRPGPLALGRADIAGATRVGG
jgi:hypothetical protein